MQLELIAPDGFSGAQTAFTGVFGVVLVVVLIGMVFGIVVAVRKYLLLKRAGHDPFTVDAAIAAKVLNSDMLRPGTAVPDDSPARTIEQRLAEVDDLHARGVISADERIAARAAILGG